MQTYITEHSHKHKWVIWDIQANRGSLAENIRKKTFTTEFLSWWVWHLVVWLRYKEHFSIYYYRASMHYSWSQLAFHSNLRCFANYHWAENVDAIQSRCVATWTELLVFQIVNSIQIKYIINSTKPQHLHSITSLVFDHYQSVKIMV